MLPVPLQLVAYLPITELVDSKTLDQRLCDAIRIGMPEDAGHEEGEDLPARLKEYSKFWSHVRDDNLARDAKVFSKFSKHFADPQALQKRAEACWHDHLQQPFNAGGEQGLTSSPAFYDWLDVDLSLDAGQDLPLISVPPWVDY